jgi:hypothetical protein
MATSTCHSSAQALYGQLIAAYFLMVTLLNMQMSAVLITD